MNQQAIITNEKLTEFCTHQKEIEGLLNEAINDLKELKEDFRQQRKDFAKYRSDNGTTITRMVAKMDSRCDNICALIGEVPKGKSVMECVRDNSARMEKLWWGIILVFGVIQFLANYPKIAMLFS